MTELSPKQARALEALEALAASLKAERAAKPQPKPKPSATNVVSVAVAKAKAVKAPSKPAAAKPKPKPALTPRGLDGSGTTAEKLRAISNVQAGSAPCTLTREQLGGPSEFMLRQARAVRDKHEAEQKKQAERDRLRRMYGLP
jgi:hypothetical protein